MSAVELNLDGIIGPTHNYAGLSLGNLASARNKDSVARPRAAALQGLAKMRRLSKLGIPQGVLPPQERPNIGFLRGLGFTGDDAAVWRAAWSAAPALARASAAASAMWAANAATISPSFDCADARAHVTPANLHTMLHRALEAHETAHALSRVLPDPAHFAHHAPLMAHQAFADEGAANHMRMCDHHGAPGLEIFIYGRAAEEQSAGFPGRQSREACEAIARRHGLAPERTIIARQSSAAIEAGAFHNDVVAVANERVLFFHEHAFEDRGALLDEIRRKAEGLFEPVFVEAKASSLSLQDAVSSYIFNAQLVSVGRGAPTLIAPTEVRENNAAAGYVRELVESGALAAVEYVEVRESMRNGGGPACLRLRVALSADALATIPQGFLLSDAVAVSLEAWIEKHYRETLSPADLADPALIAETRGALDALTSIIPLGSDFYPFQRA